VVDAIKQLPVQILPLIVQASHVLQIIKKYGVLKHVINVLCEIFVSMPVEMMCAVHLKVLDYAL
jgi:hypothetical protein